MSQPMYNSHVTKLEGLSCNRKSPATLLEEDQNDHELVRGHDQFSHVTRRS